MNKQQRTIITNDGRYERLEAAGLLTEDVKRNCLSYTIYPSKGAVKGAASYVLEVSPHFERHAFLTVFECPTCGGWHKTQRPIQTKEFPNSVEIWRVHHHEIAKILADEKDIEQVLKGEKLVEYTYDKLRSLTDLSRSIPDRSTRLPKIREAMQKMQARIAGLPKPATILAIPYPKADRSRKVKVLISEIIDLYDTGEFTREKEIVLSKIEALAVLRDTPATPSKDAEYCHNLIVKLFLFYEQQVRASMTDTDLPSGINELFDLIGMSKERQKIMRWKASYLEAPPKSFKPKQHHEVVRYLPEFERTQLDTLFMELHAGLENVPDYVKYTIVWPVQQEIGFRTSKMGKNDPLRPWLIGKSGAIAKIIRNWLMSSCFFHEITYYFDQCAPLFLEKSVLREIGLKLKIDGEDAQLSKLERHVNQCELFYVEIEKTMPSEIFDAILQKARQDMRYAEITINKIDQIIQVLNPQGLHE